MGRMILRILGISLFSALLAYCALYLYESRRPLCIDSRVVDRIDRLDQQDMSTVFKCSLRLWTENREYFEDKILHLKSRIQSVEALLQEISPFRHSIQIVIVAQQPWFFQVLNHRVYIGENLLKTQGHLERGIIKVWLRERGISSYPNREIAEEVLADFILFLSTGQREILDPELTPDQDVYKNKWPLVLKTAKEYCESNTKISEHYSVCKSGNKDLESLLNSKNLEMSVRPLLLRAWTDAYLELGLQDRYEFETLLPKFILKPAAQTIRSGESRSQGLLEYLSFMVNQFQRASLSSQDLSNFPSYTLFSAKANEKLSDLGFSESKTSLLADVIYWNTSLKVIGDSNLHAWQEIARSNPRKQIVYRSEQSSYLLPSAFGLRLENLASLQTKALIVEHCGKADFNFIDSFSSMAERLLLVSNCDQNTKIDYVSYINGGVEYFAIKNKNIAFVHFHLPSMSLKRSVLSGKSDLLALIENRDTDSSLVQALGWQELEWKKNLDAYQPKATIDGIQLFRVIRAGIL